MEQPEPLRIEAVELPDRCDVLIDHPRGTCGLTIDKGFGKSCNSLSLADLALMPSSRPYPARFGDGAPVGLARQAGASLFGDEANPCLPDAASIRAGWRPGAK